MIAGLKAASGLDKFFAAAFALNFLVDAVQLKFTALMWFVILLSHIRVLKLEHKLRALGVEP